MAGDTGRGEDHRGENRERSEGEIFVAEIDAKAAEFKALIPKVLGPLKTMVDVVAFYGSCCDLMNGAWIELYENAQDGKEKARVEILRALVLRELKRCVEVLESDTPRKVAGA